jgi:alkanesulfonate monooxygenase SsuD/methylene tetrahydromethanopterin reductase-like flavin-dependent oxidoreductase (luciferase family)
MDLGVIFPTTLIGTDPAVIRDFAQTAEGLGYRRLLTYNHVVGAVHADRDPPLAGPYTQDDPFHEPFVLLGFLAACTTTIELGVAVGGCRNHGMLKRKSSVVPFSAGAQSCSSGKMR